MGHRRSVAGCAAFAPDDFGAGRAQPTGRSAAASSADQLDAITDGISTDPYFLTKCARCLSMSNLNIAEKFVVEAAPDRVWAFLKRADLIAGCLPGAKLDGQSGPDTFLGTMKVKVGPVVQDFRGRASLVEVNDADRHLSLVGSGDEKTGGGSAKMTMRCAVTEAQDGGSEVSVTAEVELAGKLVRFGRGVFEAVAKQLFKQFVERARTQIAQFPDPNALVPTSEQPAANANAAKPEAETAQTETTTDPRPMPETASSTVSAPTERRPSTPPPDSAQKTAPVSETPSTSLIEQKPIASVSKQEEVLDAGSILFRALIDAIKGFLRRIFRLKP